MQVSCFLISVSILLLIHSRGIRSKSYIILSYFYIPSEKLFVNSSAYSGTKELKGGKLIPQKNFPPENAQCTSTNSQSNLNIEK